VGFGRRNRSPEVVAPDVAVRLDAA